MSKGDNIQGSDGIGASSGSDSGSSGTVSQSTEVKRSTSKMLYPIRIKVPTCFYALLAAAAPLLVTGITTVKFDRK